MSSDELAGRVATRDVEERNFPSKCGGTVDARRRQKGRVPVVHRRRVVDPGRGSGSVHRARARRCRPHSVQAGNDDRVADASSRRRLRTDLRSRRRL